MANPTKLRNKISRINAKAKKRREERSVKRYNPSTRKVERRPASADFTMKDLENSRGTFQESNEAVSNTSASIDMTEGLKPSMKGRGGKRLKKKAKEIIKDSQIEIEKTRSKKRAKAMSKGK
ncbi:MAG: hypothetical protein DRQ88_09310 [Epsilonproteobacteria bacterium]|nr:MAG: hypothetical protein DRQ88_09310 [Campylobacterota bacterium]